MTTTRLAPDAPIADQLRPVLAGTKLIVADLEPRDLMGLADMPEASDAVILDMRTSADALRQGNMPPQHVPPAAEHRHADGCARTISDPEALAALVRPEGHLRPRCRLCRRHRPHGQALRGEARREPCLRLRRRLPARRHGLPADPDPDAAGDPQRAHLRRSGRRRHRRYLRRLSAPTRRRSRGRWSRTQGLVATAWSPAFQEYSALQMQHRFPGRCQAADARGRLRRLARAAHPRRGGDPLRQDGAGGISPCSCAPRASRSPASRARG